MEIDTLVYAPTFTAVRALRAALVGSSFETQSPLADAIPWSRYDRVALVGPAVGAPAAVLACEPFLSRGCRRLVLFGTCGALRFGDSKIDIGDIVLPAEAICEDGTSALYGAPERFSIAPSFFDEILPDAISCPVWTTDAPLKENLEKAREFFTNGAHAVEMELSALAWLAREQGAEFAACFVVSDLVGEINRREFRGRRVQESLRRVAEVIGSGIREGMYGDAAPEPIEFLSSSEFGRKTTEDTESTERVFRASSSAPSQRPTPTAPAHSASKPDKPSPFSVEFEKLPARTDSR